MRVLAVIPARLGASRLPGKPLRLLGGAPLVVRVWERVSDLGVAERVVVATDSPEVAEAARGAGAEAVLTRADHPSGTDRVAEVSARPDCASFDVIVNVQGDEPFVSADAVRGAIRLVASGRFPLGTAAAPAAVTVLHDPDVVKVTRDDRERALYFSRAPIPWLRDEADGALRARVALRHVGVYAYSRSGLAEWVALPPHPLECVERLEQLRPLAAGLPMGVALVADEAPDGIDTEHDLERANARWLTLFARRP